MGRDLEMIFTVLSLRIAKTPNDNWLINDMFIQRNIVIMNCFCAHLICWENPHNFN